MLVPMFPIMMVIMMGKPDIDIAGGDAILHDGLHLHHIAALKWQFRELCAKIRLRHACLQEGPEQHVAADARKTVEINRFHKCISSIFSAFSAQMVDPAREHARAKAVVDVDDADTRGTTAEHC